MLLVNKLTWVGGGKSDVQGSRPDLQLASLVYQDPLARPCIQHTKLPNTWHRILRMECLAVLLTRAQHLTYDSMRSHVTARHLGTATSSITTALSLNQMVQECQTGRSGEILTQLRLAFTALLDTHCAKHTMKISDFCAGDRWGSQAHSWIDDVPG